MTAANYDIALRRVLEDEGGYCNDAGDPGGPTKYGITIFDVRKYVKPDATASDVRNLTIAQAKEIYDKHYWSVTRGNDEPAGLDYAVFDYGVNSGVGRSGKVLRKLCGLPTNTSSVSPEVLTAISKRDPKQLADAMWDERLRFLQSLSTWSRFGGGWGSRVRRGKLASQKMAIGAPAVPGGNPLPQGKGQHPEPKTGKGAVKGAGGAGAVASGGFLHWIGAHPVLSVAIACVAVALAMYALNKLDAWHEKRQTEPMPGTKPIPELKPAGA